MPRAGAIDGNGLERQRALRLSSRAVYKEMRKALPPDSICSIGKRERCSFLVCTAPSTATEPTRNAAGAEAKDHAFLSGRLHFLPLQVVHNYLVLLNPCTHFNTVEGWVFQTRHIAIAARELNRITEARSSHISGSRGKHRMKAHWRA
jgi:hypothetical protein